MSFLSGTFSGSLFFLISVVFAICIVYTILCGEGNGTQLQYSPLIVISPKNCGILYTRYVLLRLNPVRSKSALVIHPFFYSTSIFEHLLCARHYSGYRQHRSEQNRPKSWLSHGVCMLVGETDKKENK